MGTQEQIDSFHRFASEQLAGDGSDKTFDELYDQWCFENLSPEATAENVDAVQASIDDLNAGHSGRDAAEVERELRDEFNLPLRTAL